MEATLSKAARYIAEQVAVIEGAKLEAERSTVADEDLETFATIRAEQLDLGRKWATAFYSAGSYSLAIAIRRAALRMLIRLPNGYPDLGGNSATYAALVETDTAEILSRVKVPEGVAPVTASTLKDRVNKAGSENRVNFAAAALLVVTRDPKLAAVETSYDAPVFETDSEGNTVRALDEEGNGKVETITTTIGAIVAANPPGTTSDMPVPEVLANAVETRVYSGQVSSDGKRLKGFARTDIPPTWGRQPKVKATRTPKDPAGPGPEQSDPSNVEPVDWAKVAESVAQSDGIGTIEGLRLVLTVLSDTAIGKPGQKKGSRPGILSNAKRKLAASELAGLSDQAFAIGAHFNAPSGETRAKVDETRFETDSDSAEQ